MEQEVQSMEQEVQSQSPMKTALNYGLYLGIGAIIVTLIMYVAGVEPGSKLNYVQYLISIAAIWFGIKHYRDNVLGGFMSFGKALGCGTLIAAVGGLISAAYTFIHLKFIAPEMIAKILAMTEKSMLDKGTSPEQVDQALAMTSKFMTPGMMATMVIPGSIFVGFIISLVVAAVLKKEKPMFDSH